MTLHRALSLAALVIVVAWTTFDLTPPARAQADDATPAASRPSPAVTYGGRSDADGDGLRDGFETLWGVTDPGGRDSDRDGLSDSAEDLDGDLLSNLGEQRFHTDPGRRDTDADGLSDGREDRDGDGIQDFLEQDSRPVPRRLRPTLASARWDLPPSYSNGCHTGGIDPSIHPCTYGDPDGRTRVALFGDSHALQWFPALDRAADAAGWRLTTITKSACPSASVDHYLPFEGGLEACREWRRRALSWLRRNPQHVVVISNTRSRLLDQDGDVIPWARKEEAWRRGLASTIRSIPERTRVIVLGDTPHLRDSVPPCLRRHPRRISACTTRRRAAELPRHDAAERAAAEAQGEVFASLNGIVCSYDPCPVIVEDVLMWRDRTHLTATFARGLAPSVRDLVERTLAPEPTGVNSAPRMVALDTPADPLTGGGPSPTP